MVSVHPHNFRALSACLGPPVPREGLRGYLIEAAPANACHPIGGPPAGGNSSAAFIVLISRYDCPLGVKILHAQQAGYQAAIVHNVNSEKLVTMVTNVEEIRQKVGIPSVFTGESASKRKIYTMKPVLRRAHGASNNQLPSTGESLNNYRANKTILDHWAYFKGDSSAGVAH
uniref:PA domain-containing protein n=1 Tax=Gopherus evgoodei TaxID=1825980 RepID=A0A8C4XZI3_9SAUR